jgi:hypothetical protein
LPIVYLNLALYFAVNELLHVHLATAAVYCVPDAIAQCTPGEGPGAGPEDAADAGAADADDSSKDEDGMPVVAVQDAGATADMPARSCKVMHEAETGVSPIMSTWCMHLRVQGEIFIVVAAGVNAMMVDITVEIEHPGNG